MTTEEFKVTHEQIVWVLQTSAPGLSEQMRKIIADTVIRRVGNILAAPEPARAPDGREPAE
jgi:hypothetical protein